MKWFRKKTPVEHALADSPIIPILPMKKWESELVIEIFRHEIWKDEPPQLTRETFDQLYSLMTSEGVEKPRKMLQQQLDSMEREFHKDPQLLLKSLANNAMFSPMIPDAETVLALDQVAREKNLPHPQNEVDKYVYKLANIAAETFDHRLDRTERRFARLVRAAYESAMKRGYISTPYERAPGYSDWAKLIKREEEEKALLSGSSSSKT